MIRRILAVLLLSVAACAGGTYYRTLLLLPRTSATAATTGFITTWVCTNGGTITLPLRGGGGWNYNMTVDYGDGTVVNVNSNSDPDATHTYSSGDSNRTVTITGTMGGFYFNNTGSKANFRSVVSWGPISGVNVFAGYSAYNGCANFVGSTQPMDSSWGGLTVAGNMFKGCSSFTTNAPNVSALTNLTDITYGWQSCVNMVIAPSISGATKLQTIATAWSGCSKLTVPADVSSLTNVTTVKQSWKDCTSLQQGPSIQTMTKLKNIDQAYMNCSSLTNTVQSILGSPLMVLTGLVNSAYMFSGDVSLSGQGMPFVTAATSGLFAASYTIGTASTNSSYRTFYGCTNLSDYADIPAAFK